MATRPWVTPEEVRAYSERKAVQERTDARLKIDISRAEQYVITATHNDFTDYEEIPEAIKTAVIILADTYAHNAIVAARELKSESFDDYSYTAESTTVDISDLDLAALLDAYILSEPNGGVFMRMRKL